jgi:hypothetical protein
MLDKTAPTKRPRRIILWPETIVVEMMKEDVSKLGYTNKLLDRDMTLSHTYIHARTLYVYCISLATLPEGGETGTWRELVERESSHDKMKRKKM